MMERVANKKIERYVAGYKAEVKTKIAALEFEDRGKIKDLLEYVFEYPRLTLGAEDFARRKRAQNPVSEGSRCEALTGRGAQCKCRRGAGSEFCGTHAKGAPNGSVEASAAPAESARVVQVSAHNIRGILYYLDAELNVFRHEDVLRGSTNPTIVARAERRADGSLTIPSLGI